MDDYSLVNHKTSCGTQRWGPCSGESRGGRGSGGGEEGG